jgi:hypothetical protein
VKRERGVIRNPRVILSLEKFKKTQHMGPSMILMFDIDYSACGKEQVEDSQQ